MRLGRSGAVVLFIACLGIAKAEAGKPAGGSTPAFTYLGAAAGSEAGKSVGISDDRMTMVIGAPGEGAAYVYARYAAGWTLQARLEPSTCTVCSAQVTASGFGTAVAISRDGNTVIVGAPGSYLTFANGGVTLARAGAAYAFWRGGTSWSAFDPFYSPDPNPDGRFGGAVAVDATGGFVVVGASWEHPAPAELRPDYAGVFAIGAAYVFPLGPNGAETPVRLARSDAAYGDWFGTSVAISGDGEAVLVGSPGTQWNGDKAIVPPQNQSGLAYSFVKTPTMGGGWTWLLQQCIVPVNDRYQPGSQFGYSVALDAGGKTALVGAPYMWPDTGGQGGVFAFQRDVNNWAQTQLLTPNRSAIGDLFGSSVALGTGKAAIGAIYQGGYLGGAYVFTLKRSWSQTAQFVGTSNSNLGASVAISADGNSVLAGAPGVATRAGAAYLFDLAAAPVPAIWPDTMAEWPLGQYDDRSFWVAPVPGNYIPMIYLTGGDLPPGLSYHDGPPGAVLYGAPTKAGRYKLTLAMQEDTTAGYTTTRTYLIVVR